MLAHLAEMAQYWLGEIERVLDGVQEPVPFGRIATDPVRIGVVERDRSLPPRELYDRIDDALTRFDRRWRTLTPTELARRGLHPSRGELTVAQMPDRFIVGHLADHVDPARSDPRGHRQPRADGADADVFILYAIPIGIVVGLLAGGRLEGLAASAPPLGAADPPRSPRPGRDLHRRGRARGRRRRAGDLRGLDGGRLRGGPAERRRAGRRADRARRRLQPRGHRRERWLDAGRRRRARRRSAVSTTATRTASSSPTPRCGPLTDIFALPAWLPLANVFSIGDVLIGVGIAATIALAMRAGRVAAGDAPAPATHL